MLVRTLASARIRFSLAIGLAGVLLTPGRGSRAEAQPVAAPAPTTAPAPAPARAVIAAPAPGSTGAPASNVLAPERLESLVAPLALYPDPLLGQVLVASTYPLEIVEAQQWVVANPTLKGDALLEAAKKQTWDPSVQSLVAFPDVIKRMSENIRWTTELGDAFLAQQSDVMAAVQRLRTKAKDAGKLASTEQQTVTTKVVEKETVVVIQPAKTEVVYVPVYNPALVWGPPMYPYPPMYYPPPPPAGAMLVSFGVGMMVGAAMHGGWGYNCGWGHSNVVVVNHHNTFVSNSHRVHHTQVQGGHGNSAWQHDPSHRRNAPYANNDVSKKYGAAERARPSTTPSVSDRAAGPRMDSAGRPSAGSGDRGPAGGARGMDGAGGGDRAQTMDRPVAGTNDRAAGAGNRAGTAQRSGERDFSSGSRAGGDRAPPAGRQRAGRGGGGGRRH